MCGGVIKLPFNICFKKKKRLIHVFCVSIVVLLSIEVFHYLIVCLWALQFFKGHSLRLY